MITNNKLNELFEEAIKKENLEQQQEEDFKEKIIKLVKVIDMGLLPKPLGWLWTFKCPKCKRKLEEEISKVLDFNCLLSRLDGYYQIRYFYCKCGYEYIKPINCNQD